MKRFILIILCGLCSICLHGCSKGLGHFEDNSIDINKLYAIINQKSIDGDWQFPILNEQEWSGNQIQNAYALDLINLQSFHVKSSVIEAQLGELAFFQSEKDIPTVIEKAITHRFKTLQTTWGNTLLEATSIFDEVKQGKIGQYYYVIVGSDAQKVVNYIQNLK